MAYRNRSRLRVVMASPFTLVIALALFGFLAKAAWNIHAKAKESDLRLAAARIELSELESIRDAATARVKRLSTEAGVRAEVREKYHAVEPGESVAVIVDPAPDRRATSSLLAAPTETEGGFRRWLSRIFSRD